MHDVLRRHAIVQVKLTVSERDRWLRTALANGMRMTEFVREACRAHCRELQRHALFEREPVSPPPGPVKAVG